MGTRKNSQFLGAKDQTISSNDLQFEFDESDTWENTNVPEETNVVPHHSESKRLISSLRFSKKSAPALARSLPVDVPDWSKIMGKESKYDNIQGKKEVNEDNRLPPHEYLAKKRGPSFSMQEGLGRTLKGRDLCRVRDAIWKQIDFED